MERHLFLVTGCQNRDRRIGCLDDLGKGNDNNNIRVGGFFFSFAWVFGILNVLVKAVEWYVYESKIHRWPYLLTINEDMVPNAELPCQDRYYEV